MGIVSLFAALLFVFQIYFLKAKSMANKCFSFYLLNMAIIILFFLILDLEFKKIAFGALPFFTTSVLAIGPLLWIYVKIVVGHNANNWSKHFLVPLSVGGLSLVLLVSALLITNTTISGIVKDTLTYLTIGAITVVFVVQNGYYIFQSLKLYKGHLKKVGEVFSYTEKVNLSWLKLVIYGYVVFILGLVIANIVDDSLSYLLFNFTLLAYIVYSGYNALKQEPIFNDVIEREESISTPEVDVSNSFFVSLKRELLQVMEINKLFLDDSLTIHSLAKELNTNSKYLSQLINNEFEKSFVVFINEYRIDEAKELLLNDNNKHLSIEGIGYEAGFKSKSAFNAAFKKFTGETPSSFLKKGK